MSDRATPKPKAKRKPRGRAPHDDSEEFSSPRIDRMVRRLLNAAEWSLGKFEDLKEGVESPLAALECVRRCVGVAESLQTVKRELEGRVNEGAVNVSINGVDVAKLRFSPPADINGDNGSTSS